MGSISEGHSYRNRIRRERGQYAEQLACAFLQKKGLQLITKNYRQKWGEIDLIMRSRSSLIFVEVRYRSSDVFGSALDSITWRKQQRLIRAAQSFNLSSEWAKILPSRFDVVTLSGDLRSPTITWIEDAFQLDG